MLRVEVILKSGTGFQFYTPKINKKSSIVDGSLMEVEWERHSETGKANLFTVSLEEVAAILTYQVGNESEGEEK